MAEIPIPTPSAMDLLQALVDEMDKDPNPRTRAFGHSLLTALGSFENFKEARAANDMNEAQVHLAQAKIMLMNALDRI